MSDVAQPCMSGQCLCGAVRYELSGSLGEVRYCYCNQCRRATGTAFSANASVPKANYHLLSGQDVISEYRSSPGEHRAFCSKCGSPVYARIDAYPEHIRIRIGSLSGDVRPDITGHVWVSAKPEWHEINDGLPQHGEGFDSPLMGKG